MGFILGVVFGLIAVACGSIAIYYFYQASESYKKKQMIRGKIFVAICIVFTVLFLIVPFSIHTVQSGEIAVVKQFGKAVDTRGPGIHWDFWITKSYDRYDTKVKQITIDAPAYSSDAQTMDAEIVIQFQIQQDHAIDIVNNYGSLEMLSARIQAIAIEKTKTVLSSKSAMNIIETRATISPAVEEAIRKAVTSEYYVNIVSVVITNIDFSDAFESTVEDKMIAEQQKLKAEYEKEKAIIQAEQELEVAKLEAQAVVAKAEGDATAKLALANAEARSIKLKSIEVARMLGFKIIETVNGDNVEFEIDFEGKSKEEIAVVSEYLKYLEYVETWDGTLPATLVTDTGAAIILPTN